MSTTSGNARAARAAARAARASSVASVGARSIGARSIGGRGSRRGTPVAAAADPPQDDHDEIPRGMQAYGTQGQPDEAQMETAQLGIGHGANPVLNALADVDDDANPNAQLTGALPAINEGDESKNRGTETNVDNLEPHFVNPHRTGIFSRFSNLFWSARHPADAAWEAEMRQRQRFFNPSYGLTTMLILLLLVALVSAIGIHINYVSNVTNSPVLGNVTTRDYNILKHRVEVVEHHLQNMPTISTTSNTAAETQVNWFALGLSPFIDVRLSSPTTTFCDPFWKPWPLGSLLRQKCPELPISPPPKMALQSTDEPLLDRWCAPKSGGKLQLVVEISRSIIPTELIVEYMSRQTTPTGFMATAPKEIELWVLVEDDDVRAKATETIGRSFPELLEDSSPQHKTLEVSRDLGPLYIPVGRWMYNIHAPTNVQGFRMPVPLLELGVETTKLAIRVNSNWGSVDFTCLNRLRMHGVDTSGVTEDLEGPPWA